MEQQFALFDLFFFVNVTTAHTNSERVSFFSMRLFAFKAVQTLRQELLDRFWPAVVAYLSFLSSHVALLLSSPHSFSPVHSFPVSSCACRRSCNDESVAAVCLCVWHCDVSLLALTPSLSFSPPPPSKQWSKQNTGTHHQQQTGTELHDLPIDFHWGHFWNSPSDLLAKVVVNGGNIPLSLSLTQNLCSIYVTSRYRWWQRRVLAFWWKYIRRIGGAASSIRKTTRPHFRLVQPIIFIV